MTRRLGGRSAGGWAHPDHLNFLCHPVDVEEGPGWDRDVSVEENPLGSPIHSTKDSSVKAEGKAELVTLLRIGQNVFGVNPVLRSLGKEVGVLRKLGGAQMARVCSCQTEGKAADVGALGLKNSHNQALSGLQGRVQESIAIAKLGFAPGGNGGASIQGNIRSSAGPVEVCSCKSPLTVETRG